MLNLLYVDDDEDLRELVGFALRLDADIAVTVVPSGAEALALLDAGAAFDVVLLDVMMPDMDGPGVLAGMRQRPPWASTPVIFVTARALPEEIQRLRDLGAAEVITKPFDPISIAADVRGELAR